MLYLEGHQNKGNISFRNEAGETENVQVFLAMSEETARRGEGHSIILLAETWEQVLDKLKEHAPQLLVKKGGKNAKN